MTLNRNNPENPGPSDWGAIVDAVTKLNQAGTQSGVTAKASGTQANGTKISQSSPLVQIDTVGTNGDSVVLPPAYPGAMVVVINNGLDTLDVYGLLATDTINGSTSASSMNTLTCRVFACAKLGNWGATA